MSYYRPIGFFNLWNFPSESNKFHLIDVWEGRSHRKTGRARTSISALPAPGVSGGYPGRPGAGDALLALGESW